nr:immunoglobulin heavy chain junction region [Mus musculus]
CAITTVVANAMDYW